MPVYRVIYDVREGSDVSIPVIVLVLVAVGLGLWIALRADAWLWSRGAPARDPGATPHPTKHSVRLRNVGLTFAFFALLVGGSAYFLESSEKRRLRDALESGDFTVVEGHVREFQRGDREGHQDERFTIMSNGRRYTYSYRSSHRIPGFHESHGPVREGLLVRIADVDGYIARLEIAQ